MEELELWKEYKEYYNLEARDAIIEKYLNYAYSIGVKIYRKYRDFLNIDKDELFGITSFCLIKAVDNFDYSKGLSFLVFLKKFLPWYIKTELSKYMNVSIKNQLKVFNKLSSKNSKYIIYVIISLSYRNMKMLGDDSNSYAIKDNSVKDKIEKDEVMEVVSFVINNLLDERERFILKSIYFDNKKKNVISNDIGLSVQRVNQIHKQAISKIKEFLEKCYRR